MIVLYISHNLHGKVDHDNVASVYGLSMRKVNLHIDMCLYTVMATPRVCWGQTCFWQLPYYVFCC